MNGALLWRGRGRRVVGVTAPPKLVFTLRPQRCVVVCELAINGRKATWRSFTDYDAAKRWASRFALRWARQLRE